MTTLDPERQQQAKQYARISRRLWLVSNSLSALYALAWLFTGWAIGLRNWLANISPNPWLLVPSFAVLFGGLYSLLTLPLSYYSGFILPHRFDQSNQTLKDWIIDRLKGLVVSAPIGLLLLELLYLALRDTGDLWWLVCNYQHYNTLALSGSNSLCNHREYCHTLQSFKPKYSKACYDVKYP